MKKLVSSFLMLTALLASGSAMARNVSVDEAKTAAVAYLRANTDYTKVNADELELVRQYDNERMGIPAGYMFNVSDWGFIVMGGSTAMDAIIAYSYCGNIDVDNMPPAMEDWVNGWMNYVKDVQELDSEKGLDDIEEWTMLLSGETLPATKADDDVILMEEKWDQGTNAGTDYNIFCPVVGGQYCYTGCVATALAQIAHYYKFPVKPKNTKSYNLYFSSNNGTDTVQISVNFDTVLFDYSLMPNRIASSTSMDKRREISKLGYMAGVAVGMSYGVNGSGAQTKDVPGNMFRYFKYQRGNIIYRRASFPHEIAGYTSNNQAIYYDYYLSYSPYNGAVNEETYMTAIRDELMLNRPVYMDGQSSAGGSERDAAGHAFVVCGYRPSSDNMYYFNWGWGGTANGWYNLGNNNMPISGGMGNYNRMQAVVTGMVPPHADSTDIHFLGINDVEANSIDLEPAYPNPATYSVNIPYNLNAAADLFIYSMDGRLVEQRRLEAGNDEAVVRVDQMPAGVYVYRINGACGKFMVQ